MEKYATIKNKIDRNAETIKAEKEKFDALKWSEKQDAENGVKIAEKIDALTLENQILSDNARRAYVAEVLPGLLEIWNKYAGKPYGPKTKEKIQAEVKNALNVHFYASSRYSGVYDQISLCPLNEKGFSVPGYYDKFNLYTAYKSTPFVDAENKIQKVNADAVALSNCGEYVENVAERVKLIRETFAAVRQAVADLDKKISAFNAVRASDIKYIQSQYYNIPTHI